MARCSSGPEAACGYRSTAAATGAHSSTMPRLVLQPATAQVAVIAASIRSPTRAPRANSGAADACALSMNCRACMPWPGDARLTLPGLGTAMSSSQAHR
jgi:hypothetical protein